MSAPAGATEIATADGQTAQLTGQLQELAGTAGNLTLKSAILGTPRYLSPETIKGKAVRWWKPTMAQSMPW